MSNLNNNNYSISIEDFKKATNGGFDFYQFVFDKQGIKLSKYGSYRLKNPFYDDRNPSLSISYKDGDCLFYDFGNEDSKGDVITFAAHFYGLESKRDIPKILEYACRDLNINIEKINGVSHQDNKIPNKAVSENHLPKKHVRRISSSGPRFIFLEESKLKPSEPTQEDCDTIFNKINKRFSIETLKKANVKINRSEKQYGLILYGTEEIIYNPNQMSVSLHCEGRTDYLTLIEIGADSAFRLVSHFNKNTFIEIDSGEHFFLLDKDVTKEHIISRFKFKEPIKCKFININEKYKDISELHYQENMQLDDLLELIIKTETVIINPNKDDINTKIDYSILNRIKKAKEEKPMKQLFGSYLYSGEIAIIAGDSGAGKTLLGFQVADGISKGNSILDQENEVEPLVILYLDFELTNQSLLKRYPNNDFNKNFNCPDINDLLMKYSGKFSVEMIRDCINSTGASVVIVDNISAIALKSTQDQDIALGLMKEFKLLNLQKKITFLIIAHTPKIPNNIPLNINHVGGSKHLTNFCDNVSIIGKSSQGIERRYLKQLKSRNDELQDRVLVMDIINESNLRFRFIEYDDEKNHLELNPMKEQEKKNKLKEVAKTYFVDKDYGYTEFCNEYSNRTGLKFESARKVHKNLKYYNLIIQNPNNKKWMMNLNEIPD